MNQWTHHPTEWATPQNVWKTAAPFVAEYCPFLSGNVVDSALGAQQQVREFHISAGDYTLKMIAREARRLSATPVRAPLRWTVAERTSDGGVDLASLRKNWQ